MRTEEEIRAYLADVKQWQEEDRFKDATLSVLEWVLNDRVMPQGVIFWPADGQYNLFGRVAVWNRSVDGWNIDSRMGKYSQAELEADFGMDWEVLKESV